MSELLRGESRHVTSATPIAVKEVIGGEHAIIGTISTATVDRHGDIMSPEGARLDRYRRNPVVLYNHDYDGLPVGKSLWEKVSPEGITAKASFHLQTELSQEVWALIAKDILNAWSVGFIPEEWEALAAGADAADEAKGFRILRWDLLEYSAVPVPANFEALTHALKAERITAPCLVKSLAPLGLVAPDLVQPVVRASTAQRKETDMEGQDLKSLTADALQAGNPVLVGELKAEGAEEEAARAAVDKAKADAEAEKAEVEEKATTEEKLAAARDEAAQAERDRLKALKAAFPDHEAFCAEQFENGASLDEARAAYRDVQLAELKTENDKLKKQVEGASPVAFAGEEDEKSHLTRAKEYQAEHKCSVREALRKTAPQS